LVLIAVGLFVFTENRRSKFANIFAHEMIWKIGPGRWIETQWKRSTGFQPVWMTGILPVVSDHAAGKMPAFPTARMAVLQSQSRFAARRREGPARRPRTDGQAVRSPERGRTARRA